MLKKKQQTTVPSLSEADTLKLIHELEVNQIELEAINNELIQAKERADFAKQKYAALFDSASFGYFMLSREGKIIESNLIGASMFGKESLLLKNSKFDFFVSNETKPTFNLFLQEIFNSKTKGSCEFVAILQSVITKISCS